MNEKEGKLLDVCSKLAVLFNSDTITDEIFSIPIYLNGSFDSVDELKKFKLSALKAVEDAVKSQLKKSNPSGDRDKSDKIRITLDGCISLMNEINSLDCGEVEGIFCKSYYKLTNNEDFLAEVKTLVNGNGSQAFSDLELLGTRDVILHVEDLLKGMGITPTVTSDDLGDINGGISSKEPNKEDIISTILDAVNKSMSNREKMSSVAGFGSSETAKKSNPKDLTMLKRFGKCYNDKVKEFDPIFGREKEIEYLIDILSCRTKNNACLIGEPGVGKTAIIEGLAQRIEDQTVPMTMINKKIWELNLNNLLAGTQYRGEYEERLEGIINEVINNKDIIVFIDEIHNLVGHGGSSSGGDASNILKPYLSRGQFQCIGSTTIDEFRKSVEKDKALNRRFKTILVEEPTEEETVKILQAVGERYSDFHKIKVDGDQMELIVSMSGKYLSGKYPDKALDLLDLATSRAKVRALNEKKHSSDESKLRMFIQNCDFEIEKLVNEGNFDAAKEQSDLRESFQKELNEIKKSNEETEGLTPLEEQHIIFATSQLAGIPVEHVGKTDMDNLRRMKEDLEKVVIGQDRAKHEVVRALQRNSLGLRDRNRPIASFLLVGPTGSGKTYLAKTVAQNFFGSDSALIRYDMSEYSSPHNVSKLVGSTAGFVGYNDTPLFDKVKRKPYSVVLFDEIEKAHEEVFQIFLSILDDGYVTLANGTQVSFKDSIVIFTGNIGTKELERGKVGFGELSLEAKRSEDEKTVMKAVKSTFRPEFINRLSKIITFDKLTTEDLNSIIDLEIKKLNDRLKDSNYEVIVDKTLKDYIVGECDTNYGARDLQRNIVKYIEDELTDYLLDLKKSKSKFKFKYENEKVVIS